MSYLLALLLICKVAEVPFSKLLSPLLVSIWIVGVVEVMVIVLLVKLTPRGPVICKDKV